MNNITSATSSATSSVLHLQCYIYSTHSIEKRQCVSYVVKVFILIQNMFHIHHNEQETLHEEQRSALLNCLHLDEHIFIAFFDTAGTITHP